MNFDTHRKNYSGLAFVAMLHLLAAGIALKNSTIWVSHAEPGLVSLVPPKPLQPDPQPQTDNDFDFQRSKAVAIKPLEDLDIKWETEKTITTTPPDGSKGERETGGRTTGGDNGGGGGNAEVHRDAPAIVAAVIDAASCARPSYPAAALRNGDEGTVTLAFLVGKDGRVASARVERSSGHRDLDRAAMQGLSLCAFKPGTVDGVAQESWARMQYAWRLDE